MLRDRLACVLGIPGALYANRSAGSAPKQNNYQSTQMLPQTQVNTRNYR